MQDENHGIERHRPCAINSPVHATHTEGWPCHGAKRVQTGEAKKQILPKAG